MTRLQPLPNLAQQAASAAFHLAEQPAVINKLYKAAPLGYAGAMIYAAHQNAAQEPPTPQGRHNAKVKTLAMGAAALATLLAAKKWMGNPFTLAEVAQNKAAVKSAIAPLKNGQLKLTEKLEQVTKNLQNLNHHDHGHGHDHGVEEAIAFLKTGTASVAAATTAGLVANASNNTLTPHQKSEKTEAILQEATFQYLANIALCGFALGGAAKLATKLGLTQAKHPWGRSGLLAGALGVSIVFGAKIANTLGAKVIDPVVDWVKSGDLSPSSLKYQLKRASLKPQAHSTRRPELKDLMLHLDDAPLLLNAMGSELFGPAIQLFFLPSDNRIINGYRNEKPSHKTAKTNTPVLHQNAFTKTTVASQKPLQTGYMQVNPALNAPFNPRPMPYAAPWPNTPFSAPNVNLYAQAAHNQAAYY
ncbi:MAG: hypothetical protein VKJ06_05635 [Vampirovibrionales bacterium]|nr:hypothetical protein [Vampirovibrionales bacterium]